ncbi:MAG: DUF5615 family PIN-like protein [Chloroflexi bacterium]|nr:DUF5615 family PIN-like protein [Chloroflexota bacterium]
MAEFYLDHDVSVHLAPALAVLGHTIRMARSLGLERAGDQQHLLVAAGQGWILVSHNRKDFRLLHAAWRDWSQAWGVHPIHAGILIIPHGSPADSARLLHEFVLAHTPPLSNELYSFQTSTGWAHSP